MAERMSYVEAIEQGIDWRKQNSGATRQDLEKRADEFAEAWGEGDSHYWDMRSGFIRGATR